MSTEQGFVAPREHLSKFFSDFIKIAITTLVGYLFLAGLFNVLFTQLNVYQIIEEYLVTTRYRAYLVAAGVGWLMYLIYQSESGSSESNESTSGNQSNDTESLRWYIEHGKELGTNGSLEEIIGYTKEQINETAEGMGILIYFYIIISLGGLIGLLVSTYLSSTFGVALAVVYPILDHESYQRIHPIVSPGALLMYPGTLVAYFLAIAITSVISLIAGMVGLLFAVAGIAVAVPIVIALQLISKLFEVVRTPGTDIGVIRPH